MNLYDGQVLLERVANAPLNADIIGQQFTVVMPSRDQRRSGREDAEAAAQPRHPDTRPIFHKCDETIRGHVFCSFLALLLRKELEDRLARKEWKLEWADVIRDLDNIIEMEVAISGKGYVFRGQTSGVAGKVFQACGVALPPAMRSC